MEIKKSKFLGYVFEIESEKQTQTILENLKKEHKKARHIAWAFIITSPHQEKCNDDGEPSGTAGRPILNVLQKRGLSNIMVAVVRYFGGIKLGAGGLVRAYSKATTEALEEHKCK
ncbi:MAG: IMPACT family protein [Clostridia bacterium]|nr:YigZ family protein [Clostridia bacterium]